MAGGELTTLGNQHSDLLAGLVYLDALGDPRDWPATDPAYRELLNQLPEVRRGPPVVDRSSFSAYRASRLRNEHFAFPESELRQLYAANPELTGTKAAFHYHLEVAAGESATVELRLRDSAAGLGDDFDEVMTAREVADLLKMPVSTIYQLARRGELPARRLGRTWRFLRPRLEEMLAG